MKPPSLSILTCGLLQARHETVIRISRIIFMASPPLYPSFRHFNWNRLLVAVTEKTIQENYRGSRQIIALAIRSVGPALSRGRKLLEKTVARAIRSLVCSMIGRLSQSTFPQIENPPAPNS